MYEAGNVVANADSAPKRRPFATPAASAKPNTSHSWSIQRGGGGEEGVMGTENGKAGHCVAKHSGRPLRCETLRSARDLIGYLGGGREAEESGQRRKDHGNKGDQEEGHDPQPERKVGSEPDRDRQDLTRSIRQDDDDDDDDDDDAREGARTAGSRGANPTPPHWDVTTQQQQHQRDLGVIRRTNSDG